MGHCRITNKFLYIHFQNLLSKKHLLQNSVCVSLAKLLRRAWSHMRSISTHASAHPRGAFLKYMEQSVLYHKKTHYERPCKNSPLLSFGSNQVDLGGIKRFASATSKSS